MTTPEPGWYSDPQVPDQLRWWDGTAWTAHTAPAPATAPGTPMHDGFPSPGAPRADSSSGGGMRPGVVLGVLAVVGVLLIGALVATLLLLGGDEDTTQADDSDQGTDPDTDEDPDESDDEGDETDRDGDRDGGSANPETLEADGEAASLTVDRGESASLTLTVEEAGLYHVQTASSSGNDPMLSLNSPEGTQIASVDDGGADSSNTLDAGIVTHLEPGDYEVVVDTFFFGGADTEVSATSVEADESALEPGDFDLSIDDGDQWIGTVDLAEGETLTVDVRGDGPGDDGVLNIVMPDHTHLENDDRGSDASGDGSVFDPYLEVRSSEAGTATIIVGGYGDGALDGTVTVEVED
ncbi:MAG: DUF2510 domain-containing protein [Nesterenkonia sp.]|uniref:DUF2510 domain-containing protein n=1 Tax=Nesterenkonia marinintestina TaxID=2979865 RepID=UPI0021C05293|nr:DUF2510 domain-containing protein [Nesterenkonia sp. GX14115]MDO5492379.1 DUF2510 domain-containing protein [Nesterenkonia sp.]